jgi:hypothetical protein
MFTRRLSGAVFYRGRRLAPQGIRALKLRGMILRIFGFRTPKTQNGQFSVYALTRPMVAGGAEGHFWQKTPDADRF